MSAAAEQEHWTNGPLYKHLVQVLPTFAKDPFATSPKLDVQKLNQAVGKSHEAVYKWLRAGKLTPANVKTLVELANRADNVAALKALGRNPPTREDFTTFVFA